MSQPLALQDVIDLKDNTQRLLYCDISGFLFEPICIPWPLITERSFQMPGEAFVRVRALQRETLVKALFSGKDRIICLNVFRLSLLLAANDFLYVPVSPAVKVPCFYVQVRLICLRKTGSSSVFHMTHSHTLKEQCSVFVLYFIYLFYPTPRVLLRLVSERFPAKWIQMALKYKVPRCLGISAALLH